MLDFWAELRLIAQDLACPRSGRLGSGRLWNGFEADRVHPPPVVLVMVRIFVFEFRETSSLDKQQPRPKRAVTSTILLTGSETLLPNGEIVLDAASPFETAVSPETRSSDA